MQVLATYNIKGARVASAADVERMGMHQALLPVFVARSPARRSFGNLWSEVKGRLS